MEHTGIAAFYRTVSDVVFKQVNFDGIGSDERIIQVEACGICGTDVNAILRGSSEYLSVGHEVAGRMINGDGSISANRVVLESSSACGRCNPCRNARQDLCLAVRSFFRKPYFGIAERMLAPEVSMVPYSNLDPAIATLAEPLGVAIDLCEVSAIGLNSIVLIAGLGPIGLMALRLAKLAGAAKIYGVSYSHQERRNALALEFGADELLFEDEKPLPTRVLNPPPDRILSSVPPSCIAASIPVAANGGVITYIGVGHGETDRIALPANDFHFKKLQLRSSYAAPALRTPMALEYLQTGRIDGARLISHRFPLQDAPEAIRVACLEKRTAIKVVVVMP